MPKLKPFKDVIADEMDRRWKRFLKLNDQYNKRLDDNDETKKKKKYKELAEAAHDMEPVEHYILEWNPTIKDFWKELKIYHDVITQKDTSGSPK